MELALALLLKYKYLILFPLAAFEGPLISLVVGFLIYNHTFDFWPAFLILLIGDILPDSVFYAIGYYGHQTGMAKKYVLENKLFKNHLNVIKKLWMDHPKKTMFFGKLAYGMALPFLISAGVVKMPYKKFITTAIPISIFQYGIITYIGYILGNSYESASYYVSSIYYVFGAFVIIFIIVYLLIMRYARDKAIELFEEEEKEIECKKII